MNVNQKSENNIVLAKTYAENHGDTEENVVKMIRDGRLAGKIVGDTWYVNTLLSSSIILMNEKIYKAKQRSNKSDKFIRKIAALCELLFHSLLVFGVITSMVVFFPDLYKIMASSLRWVPGILIPIIIIGIGVIIFSIFSVVAERIGTLIDRL